MNNTKIRPILDGNGQVTYPLTCTEAVVDETGSLSSKLEAIQDQLDNYQPIEITGNVTNAADEEDITSVNDLLKFKNRNSLNGYGYYILRRNATIGSQMTLSNTIYEVRYNFDISTENPVEIPSGCILYFNGGSFIGGTLVGNQTYVNRLGDYSIFNGTSREGTWKAIQDINQLAAQVAENTSDISSLTTQVGTNTGNISTNTDDIRTLSGYVSTNTDDISTLSTNYTNLSTAVGTNTSDISNLSSSLSTLSGNALTKVAQTLTTAEKDQVATNLINKDATNGMARIELKATDNFKSVVEAQTEGNTVFVIKYDFTLTGDVTVPSNCILNFQGGSLSGAYTITGANTGIQAGLVKIFNTNATLAGSWNVVEAYPEWFGAKGDGTTDDTAAIRKCFYISNVSLQKGKIYAISDYLDFKSDNQIVYGNSATIKALNDISSTHPDTNTYKGQLIVSIGKSNCCIYNLNINGTGFQVGGILDRAGSKNKYKDIYIKDCLKSPAIDLVGSDNVIVEGIIANNCHHGVQMWESSSTITSCEIKNIIGGGIWGARTINCVISNNNVENCTDVGIDIEGGSKCIIEGNNVKNCVNGNLAIFKDANNEIGIHNIVFTNNNSILNVTSFDINETTYNIAANSAAFRFFSSNSGNTNNVEVLNNNLVSIIENKNAIFTDGLELNTEDSINISNNVLKGRFYTNGISYMTFANNTITANHCLFKDTFHSTISSNTFIKEDETDTNYLVRLYTDINGGSENILFIGNNLKVNNQYRLWVDPSTYIGAYVFVIQDNILGYKPTVDGGIKIHQSSFVKFVNQKLLLSSSDSGFDLSSLFPYNDKNMSAIGKGVLTVINNSSHFQNIYELYFSGETAISSDGTGASSGKTTSSTGYINTISGNTITLSSNMNKSWLDIELTQKL